MGEDRRAMEDPNLEETRPIEIGSPGQQIPMSDASQQATMPVRLSAAGSRPAPDAVTQAIRLQQGEEPAPVEANAPAFADTQATPVAPLPAQPGAAGVPPAPPASKKARRRPRWPWITLLGILGLILAGVLAAYVGYQSGIQMRQEAAATQAAQQLQDQFNLAMQEIDSKQLYRAQQRLQYIIEHNPNFPGATDRLAEVMLQMNATATPAPVPTATGVPTALPAVAEDDLQGFYNLSQQALANGDWNTAIDTALQLRQKDANFNPVLVDGILFMALRNRGIDKIGKQADLEGGMYDLSQAERFGPLDSEAQGYLNWSSLYITGASFWELDMCQAAQYFAQVAGSLPNLRDGSGISAGERYRQALSGCGTELMQKGTWCEARQQYEQALAYGSSPEIEAGLQEALVHCP